jgi:hypothetical protein
MISIILRPRLFFFNARIQCHDGIPVEEVADVPDPKTSQLSVPRISYGYPAKTLQQNWMPARIQRSSLLD